MNHKERRAQEYYAHPYTLFYLELSDDLMELLKIAAIEHKRSLAGELAHRIKASFGPLPRKRKGYQVIVGFKPKPLLVVE